MTARNLSYSEIHMIRNKNIIEKITNSKDVAIWIEGEHACMTTRGIKKSASKTVTTTFRGRFLEDEKLINRIIGMYKKNGN